MLLRSALVDWCAWKPSSSTRHVGCLVDEVLQQIALVFGQSQDLGLLNDISQICYKVASLC